MVWLYADIVQGGGRAELLVSAVDVDEMRRLDRRQLVAEKLQAIGQLGAGVAHNLNNRLASVIGNADLLLDGLDSADPACKEVKQIRADAAQAAALVKDLADLNLPRTPAHETIELNAAVSQILPLLQRVVGLDIRIAIDAENDPLMVRADRQQVEQILIELAINVGERLAGSGTLTIRTGSVGDQSAGRDGAQNYRYIELTDDGDALPQRQLDRIFEPFFAPGGPFVGTNLGLAAAYGIIKRNGGEITATSDAGVGTTLRVLLPVSGPDAADRKKDATTIQGMTQEAARNSIILVVEDELPVRRFAVRALEKRGYDVIEAESGEEALEILANAGTEVDLILSDVMMPTVDGPALLREVRAQRPEIKVIMISGYGESILQGVLDQHEGVLFLPKPFTLDELIAKVEVALG
ncbi:MAG: response regulator [Proteobacteria bacterium]|nr:response regulator [Pseudomonadota bacterium]